MVKIDCKCISNILQVTSFCSSSPFVSLETRGHRLKLVRRKLDLSAKDSIIFSLMGHPRSYTEKFDKQEVFNGARVVGRNNDISIIKNLLLQNNLEGVFIIPVVGLIGSGKTTLARLIFDDQEEGWNFDLRIWVRTVG
jgi:ABC-type molybdenum transport system ATPase subunit/photorepair protein PhrA